MFPLIKMNQNFNRSIADTNIQSLNLYEKKKHVQVQPHSELEETWTFAFPAKGPKQGESLVYSKTQKAMIWSIPVGEKGERGPIGPIGRQGPVGPELKRKTITVENFTSVGENEMIFRPTRDGLATSYEGTLTNPKADVKVKYFEFTNDNNDLIYNGGGCFVDESGWKFRYKVLNADNTIIKKVIFDYIEKYNDIW